MQIKKMFTISELLYKKISQTITAEEEEELLRWNEKRGKNRIPIKELIREQSLKSCLKVQKQFNSKPAYKSLLKKIKKERQFKIIRSSLKYAAILILLIGIPAIIYKNYSPSKNSNTYSDIVKPGEQKAVLILSDGKQIELNQQTINSYETKNNIIENTSRELIYSTKNNSNTTKIPASKIKYNTLIVPMGGEYRLVLGDSSVIIINSGSTFTFPEIFAENSRKVTLKGEAYFEIKHNPNKPFIIETKDYLVNVLGTSFNLCQYPDDEEVHTTLISGKLKVSQVKGIPDKDFILHPGQQFNLNKKTLQANIKEVDTELYIAWNKGYFLFEDESLENIFQKLSRWYDLKVFFKDDESKALQYSGKFQRFENFNVILDMIKTIDNVDFKVNNKTISIKKQ